jgi:multicomponent Na+:H+ antiporter subunit F
MSEIYLGIALFLLLNLAGGLIRILRGPTRSDRTLAAQLFGTTGVAVLLVLAAALGRPALRDVAVVFALLAAVNTVVFVRYAGGPLDPRGRGER